MIKIFRKLTTFPKFRVGKKLMGMGKAGFYR
jgi:hypothetical protein